MAELTAVKNKKGQWNLLVKPVKELKFSDKKIERIGEFHLEVESVKVLDLSLEGKARTVLVKKQSEPATSTARQILIQKFCPRCKFCSAK